MTTDDDKIIGATCEGCGTNVKTVLWHSEYEAEMVCAECLRVFIMGAVRNLREAVK